MKPYLIIFVSILCLSSCSLREREKEIERRTTELNEKEQQLLLKEQTLKLKEDELAIKESRLDSSIYVNPDADTARTNPLYFGSWHVRMDCIETSCTGSAVGDSKIEQWTIDSADNGVIVRARVGAHLVRVYSGRQQGGYLQLVSEETGSSGGNVKMLVRLQVSGEVLEGRREITRPGECRIVYSLDLKRFQPPA
ncbi:MAG TPA: hypothetical protein VLC28_10000 [Flavitalea sp.]|nr:hypothetical protein [Flavitalea sp.]